MIELGRVTRTESLAPLLYDIVRGQKLVPPPVEQDWRRFYYANALRNIQLLHQLQDMLRHPAAEGAAVLLLLTHAISSFHCQSMCANVTAFPIRSWCRSTIPTAGFWGCAVPCDPNMQ